VRLGAAVGAMLAQQHARISAADVAGWLPHQPSWPESHEWIRERLVRVVDDRKLLADADAVMAAYEAVPGRYTSRGALVRENASGGSAMVEACDLPSTAPAEPPNRVLQQ